MRVAVVSDIHGNLTAFEAVLADIRQCSPDLILHGGDLAAGGSSPIEIVDRIRSLGWQGVMGNADEMLVQPDSLEEFASRSSAPPALWEAIRQIELATRSRLGEERLAWLCELPSVKTQRHHARGNVVLVRYADDTVAGFEYETDAKRFLADLHERLEKFALSLNPDKTRLIEFGRFAAERRARRGLGKPETFNFLGFTHICGHSRSGYFLLKRKTRRDRMRVRLRAIKEELRRRMHEPIPEQGRWLGQVLRGYLAYHAVPTNAKSLCAFRHHVTDLWRRSLRRRSQRDRTTWDRAAQLVAAFLPAVRIIHPWPHDRFAVKHPRWKPGARIALAGFCAGGAQQ
jgi:hypothetical protein